MKTHSLSRHADPYPEDIKDPTILPEADQLAMKAAGATARWWGPILRPWAPDPYGESNLRQWFLKHWQYHSKTSPIGR